jgi:hypothetical protein
MPKPQYHPYDSCHNHSPCDTLILEREAVRIRDPVGNIRGEAEVPVQFQGGVFQVCRDRLRDRIVFRREHDGAAFAALFDGR